MSSFTSPAWLACSKRKVRSTLGVLWCWKRALGRLLTLVLPGTLLGWLSDERRPVVQLQAMLKYLRGIKEAELNKKLAALAVERFKFAYRHKLSSTETATSVIMAHMCTKYDAAAAGAAGAGQAAAAEPDEEEEDEDER